MEIILKDKAIYSNTLIPLPIPNLVVFYNGTESRKEYWEVKLSDAFEKTYKQDQAKKLNINPKEVPDLDKPLGDIEATVKVININYGYNEALLEKSPALKGYSYLISKIRENAKAGHPKREAIDLAVQDTIAEGLLVEYLNEKGYDIINTIVKGWEVEVAMQYAKEESYEEGREEGIEIGIEKGRDEGEIRTRYMFMGQTVEEIAHEMELPVEDIQAIIDKLGI